MVPTLLIPVDTFQICCLCHRYTSCPRVHLRRAEDIRDHSSPVQANRLAVQRVLTPKALQQRTLFWKVGVWVCDSLCSVVKCNICQSLPVQTHTTHATTSPTVACDDAWFPVTSFVSHHLPVTFLWMFSYSGGCKDIKMTFEEMKNEPPKHYKNTTGHSFHLYFLGWWSHSEWLTEWEQVQLKDTHWAKTHLMNDARQLFLSNVRQSVSFLIP